MGIWARLMGREVLARETVEIRAPEARRVPYTGRTQAGILITPDLALQNDTVWACHRYLTQTVAQLPVQVYQLQPDGKSKLQPRHPVMRSLAWRVNPDLSPFQFKETMLGWALLRGNGYAEIEKDASGRLLNLWPIHPERVVVRYDPETGKLFYDVSNGTLGRIRMESDEIFHLRGFGDGPVGLSVVEYAAQTLGWAQATGLFGASFFGEGMNATGIVEVPGKVDAPFLKRLRAELEGLYKGPKKSHRTAILDGGMKWTKTSTTPNDGQFIETLQFQVESVCRWFGVPPHKVQHLLRSTFTNIEHQAIEIVTDAIVPWAIRFEEEANFKLFGANQGNFFIKMDVKGLLRGDFTTRQQGLLVMRNAGIISGDEWRAFEDMEPMEAGAGGEKRVMQMAMTTLERIGELPPQGNAEVAPGESTGPAQAPKVPAPAEAPAAPESPEPAPGAKLQRLAAVAERLLETGVLSAGALTHE